MTDKLQTFNDEFTKKQKEKKDLEDSIVKCKTKAKSLRKTYRRTRRRKRKVTQG